MDQARDLVKNHVKDQDRDKVREQMRDQFKGGGLNPKIYFDKSKIPTVHIVCGIILFPQCAAKNSLEIISALDTNVGA